MLDALRRCLQAPSLPAPNDLTLMQFSLGVNYWPRRSAMYWWRRFDLTEVREDFARIAALGLQTVRFFIDWDAFAPTADTLDPLMCERFVHVLDELRRAGLRGMPTLFCGHMSGCNWLPGWSLDPEMPHGRFRTITGGRTSPYGIGDFYAREDLLAAQERLARRLGSLARGHEALYCWDLGNEFSNMREPASPRDAAAWSARMTEVLLATSDAMVTGGIHGEDLSRDRNIRPSSISAPWQIATMHGYPVYSAFARSRTDANVVPFLGSLTSGFTNKALLFSELGNPSCPPGTVSPYDRVPLPDEPAIDAAALPADAAPYACLTDDEMATYASSVLHRLQQRGAIGAMWWCYADYAPALASLPPFDLAPHELRFGIVRADGSLKPVAHALQQFANEEHPVVEANNLPVDEAAYYAALPDSMQHAYEEYCHHYAD